MAKAKRKFVVLADNFDSDTIDELIGPICTIADLNRTGSDGELNLLIEAARIIKEREGFEVVTMKL